MCRTNPLIKHDHPKHDFLAEFESAYDKLKKDVDTSTAPIRELHKTSLRKLNLEAAGLLTWHNIRGTLYRIRSLKMPNCHNISELDDLLNNNDLVYKTYGQMRGKPFYNGSVNGQLIFSNPNLIEALDYDFELFIDATFGVVPYKQEQLLVVMATLQNKPRPIIYAIMSDRTQKTYEVIFKFIKQAVLPANKCFGSPKSITMDFEKAMRNAALKTWPGVSVFGCNFHMCQAIDRKASSLNYLQKSLELSAKHNELLTMIRRISLLPLNMVYDGIKAIKLFMEMDKELNRDFCSFFKYFESTWIKRYPPHEWCVSSQRFRTNNHVEGHNHKIKQWIPINPTPWFFLEGLLDLAYDASAEFVNAREKNLTYPDNSKITPLLNLLMPQLLEGSIDELEFLSKLA
jgi:hypothetical protein